MQDLDSLTQRVIFVCQEVIPGIKAEKVKKELSALARAHKPFTGVSIPVHILHGENDSTVPVEDSREFADKTGGPVTLETWQETEHIFSRREPLFNAVLSWAKKQS